MVVRDPRGKAPASEDGGAFLKDIGRLAQEVRRRKKPQVTHSYSLKPWGKKSGLEILRMAAEESEMSKVLEFQ